VLQNWAGLQFVYMFSYAGCRFTYTVRVFPYALLFLSSQLQIRFIIHVRYLEVYIKVRGANSIIVSMPSTKVYPETTGAVPQNERLIFKSALISSSSLRSCVFMDGQFNPVDGSNKIASRVVKHPN
jgi:hypothetical protein